MQINTLSSYSLDDQRIACTASAAGIFFQCSALDQVKNVTVRCILRRFAQLCPFGSGELPSNSSSNLFSTLICRSFKGSLAKRSQKRAFSSTLDSVSWVPPMARSRQLSNQVCHRVTSSTPFCVHSSVGVIVFAFIEVSRITLMEPPMFALMATRPDGT